MTEIKVKALANSKYSLYRFFIDNIKICNDNSTNY